ncbi:hypothetical protein BCR44DRAFT_1432396 [Catenaria anguillulae PL171]|uniref:Pentacotripeptide-repeat region of PRORP domain-containing protein n=1 Tax=Catenaria anguillulae PL171 TaxID=765915 RepID=A0A1Y2HSJ0_9FUNG|nr:hypothetical protein BCR44DRAFT_1432396 [Catenaria anguillulae PL171]
MLHSARCAMAAVRARVCPGSSSMAVVATALPSLPRVSLAATLVPRIAHSASTASADPPVTSFSDPPSTTTGQPGPAQKLDPPEISIARMLHHAHRRQPRQAIAIYTQLVASGRQQQDQLLTPADLLVLINAIRQRQASQSDVHALVAILDHLERLAPGSSPVPAMELAVVRAAQCNMPDVVFTQFAKLEQACANPGQLRLPAVAALLNTHRKLGNLEQVHQLAAKYQSSVAPTAPWVFHRIRLDAEAARKDDPELGLANARRLFAEYIANEPQPAALAKAFARMALIELDKGHMDQATQIMTEFAQRKVDPTASTCHAQLRLSLLANPKDIDTALGYWRHELKLARKAGQAGLSTELVLQAMLDAGKTDLAVMGVLSEYSAACRANIGFARVKYSPYAVVVRHWLKHASNSDKESLISKIESVWMQIPGTPFLHDYAVEMMCRAWMALGEEHRAKTFVQECEKRGYVPREGTGWSVQRVEKEVRSKME